MAVRRIVHVSVGGRCLSSRWIADSGREVAAKRRAAPILAGPSDRAPAAQERPVVQPASVVHPAPSSEEGALPKHRPGAPIWKPASERGSTAGREPRARQVGAGHLFVAAPKTTDRRRAMALRRKTLPAVFAPRHAERLRLCSAPRTLTAMPLRRHRKLHQVQAHRLRGRSPGRLFHEGPEFPVIDPDEASIARCAKPECPINAIFPEDDVPWAEPFCRVERNWRTLAGATTRNDPPADAAEWTALGKLLLLER